MAGFFAIKPGWNETTYDYSMKKVFALFGPPIGSTWIFLPYFIPCTVYDYCLSMESFIFSTYYVGNIIFWNLTTLRIFFWSLLIKSCVWDCTRFWLINILKDKISQPRITTEISCRPLHPVPQKISSKIFTKIEDCVTIYWPLVYFLSCTSVKKIQTLTIEDNVVFRSDLSSKFLF